MLHNNDIDSRVCGSSGALSRSAIPEELVTKGQGIILHETETEDIIL